MRARMKTGYPVEGREVCEFCYVRLGFLPLELVLLNAILPLIRRAPSVG